MRGLLHKAARQIFLLILVGSSAVHSATLEEVQGVTCPDADMWGARLITDICWSCLFPIRIMGVDAMTHTGNQHIPAAAANKSFHWCMDNLGVAHLCIPVGMWAPARIVEVVRKPYCSPVLGGIHLHDSVRMMGKAKTPEPDIEKVFYNYHYFSFPLYFMLDLLFEQSCSGDGITDLDLMYLSEVDPTWNDDELAFFTNPEVALFANPLAAGACVADCSAATAGAPLESMFWCAGCWGGLYPFTGNAFNVKGSPPRVAALLTTKAIASLHRRGLARRTMGNDVLCGSAIYPTIPKTQYRFQHFYPLAEASSSPPDVIGGNVATNRTCCHPIGQSQFLWGEWRNIPGIGEDFVNIVWRWSDCCI